jgi:hypothetical protein
VIAFTFAIQVVIAAATIIGGPIQIVGGLVEADWGRVAAGVVGLLLGGAFATMAYAHWTTHKAAR